MTSNRLDSWKEIAAYLNFDMVGRLRQRTLYVGGVDYRRIDDTGLHVTIGAIMLLVIWLRVMKGHFTPDKHFAFEGVAWYWHFVDVVWLGLFIFVYWL